MNRYRIVSQDNGRYSVHDEYSNKTLVCNETRTFCRGFIDGLIYNS